MIIKEQTTKTEGNATQVPAPDQENQTDKKAERSFNPFTLLKKYLEKKATNKAAKLLEQQEKKAVREDIAFAQNFETHLRRPIDDENDSTEPEVATLAQNELDNAFKILEKIKAKKDTRNKALKPDQANTTTPELNANTNDQSAETEQTEPEPPVEKPAFYQSLRKMFKEEQEHAKKLAAAGQLHNLLANLEISPTDLAQATPEDIPRLRKISQDREALERKIGKTIENIRNDINSARNIEKTITLLQKQKDGEVVSSEVVQILDEWIQLHEGLSIAQTKLAKLIQSEDLKLFDDANPYDLENILTKFHILQLLQIDVDDILSLVETSNKLLLNLMKHVEKLSDPKIKNELAEFIKKQEQEVFGDVLDLAPVDQIIDHQKIEITLKYILKKADLNITDLDPTSNPDLAELYKELGVEVTQDEFNSTIFNLTDDSALGLLILSQNSSQVLTQSTKKYVDLLQNDPAYATAAALDFSDLISSRLNYANLDLIVSSALKKIKEKQNTRLLQAEQEPQTVAEKNEKSYKGIFNKAKEIFARIIRKKDKDDGSTPAEKSNSEELGQDYIDQIEFLIQALKGDINDTQEDFNIATAEEKPEFDPLKA